MAKSEKKKLWINDDINSSFFKENGFKYCMKPQYFVHKLSSLRN